MANFIPTIEIPESKVERSIARHLAERPIPQVLDPEWIDPGDGTEHATLDKYTVKEWVEIGIYEYLRMVDNQGAAKIAEAAKDKTDMFDE